MRKYILFFSILFFLLLLLFMKFSSRHPDNDNKTPPLPAEGILDLREWDFNVDGSIRLDGEWDFFPSELLLNEDFAAGKPARKPSLVPVPMLWNNIEMAGQPLSGQGYGTYRLKVLVSEDAVGSKLKAATFDHQTSYLIAVNDEKVAGAGVVGSSPYTTQPLRMPAAGTFYIPAAEFNIIMQVANFSRHIGGILGSIHLGDEHHISNMLNTKLKKEALVAGVFFAIFVYYMIIFFYRRDSFTSLYFALYCLVMFIRMGITGESMVLSVISANSFHLHLMIDHITYYLILPFLLHFLYGLFSDYISFRLIRVVDYLTVPFVILVFLTPSQISDFLIIIYEPLLGIGFLYIVGMVVYMSFKKVRYAPAFLWGFMILLITAINDELYYLNEIESVYLMHYGIITIILIQAGVLAISFAQDYKDKEKALREVEELNKTLEIKVEERTRDLTESNEELFAAIEELADTNEKLQLMDKHKTDIINLVAHDLRSPITSVYGFSQLIGKHFRSLLPVLNKTEGIKISRSADTILKNVSIIEHECQRLTNMINDFLDLSKLEEGKMHLNRQQVSIEDVINSSLNSVLPQIETKKLQYLTEIEPGLPPVSGDRDKLIQVMINLLTNAMKFTQAGVISCRAYQENNEEITVAVTDTGIGISEEEQKIVFDKFSQSAKQESSGGLKGTGLGLAICRQIIELHGGRIGVESEKGRGSTFFFRLKTINSRD